MNGPSPLRVLVIGSPGAGKSTLARQLGELLRLPVIHLDAHFWQPGWVHVPFDEWEEMVERLTEGETWIMDGNYGTSLYLRIPAADTIIHLDFPRYICIWRVLKRLVLHYGRTRPDLAPGCPERIDLEFMKWVWGFQCKIRPYNLRMLDLFAHGKHVITLRHPREIREFLRTLAPGQGR